MRIVLLELKLVSSNNLATGVENQEARTCSTLINGTNEGRVGFAVEERHYGKAAAGGYACGCFCGETCQCQMGQEGGCNLTR